MCRLFIRMLGKFSAELGEQQIPELATGRANELLCFLLLKRGRPHSRELLATELRGDGRHARKYLRQSLWQLQAVLNDLHSGLANRFLAVGPDRIELNLGEELWLDLAEFEELAQVARARSVRDICDADIASLCRAVELYRGDLLEGCSREWCFATRERLEDSYLAVLEKLAACSEAKGEYANGLLHTDAVLSRDRARESAHRRAMRLRYLLGDRTSALRQYERCAAALRAELGVAPAAGTTRLYQQIKTDTVAVQSNGSSQVFTREEELLLLQLRIQESRAALSDMELHVRQLLAG
jgi:DNA-binding SARP family transcriptional activator